MSSDIPASRRIVRPPRGLAQRCTGKNAAATFTEIEQFLEYVVTVLDAQKKQIEDLQTQLRAQAPLSAAGMMED